MGTMSFTLYLLRSQEALLRHQSSTSAYLAFTCPTQCALPCFLRLDVQFGALKNQSIFILFYSFLRLKERKFLLLYLHTSPLLAFFTYFMLCQCITKFARLQSFLKDYYKTLKYFWNSCIWYHESINLVLNKVHWKILSKVFENFCESCN